MKNLTKKQKITYVVITIIILAIIGTIIGVVTHKAKKPELIECKETEQQIKEEEVTNELPKDYKGEVDIVEEEIEVKGKDGKVEKKVVRKAVPKGQGKQKALGAKPNTNKPNNNNNTTKPNTTKPNNNTTHEHYYHIPVWKTTEIPVYSQRTVYMLVRSGKKFYDYNELQAYINANWDTHDPGDFQYQLWQEDYQTGTKTEKYIDHYKCDCGATSYDRSY